MRNRRKDATFWIHRGEPGSTVNDPPWLLSVGMVSRVTTSTSATTARYVLASRKERCEVRPTYRIHRNRTPRPEGNCLAIEFGNCVFSPSSSPLCSLEHSRVGLLLTRPHLKPLRGLRQHLSTKHTRCCRRIFATCLRRSYVHAIFVKRARRNRTAQALGPEQPNPREGTTT